MMKELVKEGFLGRKKSEGKEKGLGKASFGEPFGASAALLSGPNFYN